MATTRHTMDELMAELSYLLGETTVPSTGVDGRKSFLQGSLEDAWKAFPWPFSMTDTTLTFSNGVASLPDDFLPEGYYALSKDSREVQYTDYDDRANAVGTTYYIRYSDDEYQAVLLNDSDFTAEFRYQYTCPNLITSTTRKAPYPNKKTIATGALRYVVKADNPEADNSQEESTFTAKVQEDYSAFNRARMRNRRARTIASVSGHSGSEN